MAVAGIREATAGVGATVITMVAGVIAAECITAASIAAAGRIMAVVVGTAVEAAVTAMVVSMAATGKRLFFLNPALCPAVET